MVNVLKFWTLFSFCSLIEKNVAYQSWNLQSKLGKPWSDCLIWVCTVCLGRFVRRLLFKISEHLPLPTFINLYHLCSTSEGTGENACVCPGMPKHFLLASAIHCIIRIYQRASWWQTAIPRDRFFYPILTWIKDYFSCSLLNTEFLYSKKVSRRFWICWDRPQYDYVTLMWQWSHLSPAGRLFDFYLSKRTVWVMWDRVILNG